MGTIMDKEDDYRTLREYSRVDAFLPVRIRRVLDEEKPHLRSRASMESAFTVQREMPETDDSVLSECLRILNAKLDTIIQMLVSQSHGYEEMHLEQVNISAGGLSACARDAFVPGELAEIRLVLPTSPSMMLYVYGEVVKSDQAGERCQISVEFTEIDEDIREQIAKYVFERQRELLRKKRRQ